MVEDKTLAIGVAGLVDVDQRRNIKRTSVEVITVTDQRMKELRLLALMPLALLPESPGSAHYNYHFVRPIFRKSHDRNITQPRGYR